MNKILLMTVAAMMTAMSVQAQRIEVVDANGHGIPLVSVLTEEGNLIGTTNMDGVVPDVKGAAKVAVTHVAYKPQLVTVASLTNGRVTMEDLDYNINEIVVMPKPYVYVETYYRFYAFINDSLRYYQAGILPNAYDIQKKKVETGSQQNSCGDFYPSFGVGVTWGARVMEFHAGKIYQHLDYSPEGNAGQRYFLTLTDEGNGRRRISNPEGTLGYLVAEGNQMRTTIDGGKAQMYRNKRLGQDKALKKREEMEYAYQYTDIFTTDDSGNCNVEDLVMYTNHWEWTKSKGRYKMIIETYAVDRGYVNKQEWKDKKKELKQDYKSGMTLDQLEAYAAAHHIPALAPTLRRAIEGLNKKK